MTAVLLLNADHLPLRVISWERAICMLLDGRARLVEQVGDKVVRAMSTVVPWPAVVALTKYVKQRGQIKFKRSNVIARDEYTCQYCGCKPTTPTGLPDTGKLTIDHVTPRSRAFLAKGRRGEVASVKHHKTGEVIPATGWLNCVAACIPCNGAKADRTPAQAGMTLLREPFHPGSMTALRIWLLKAQVPEEGRDYLMLS